MKPVFDQSYYKFGFRGDDGNGVYFSFYETELHLKRFFWNHKGSTTIRKKIKNYLIERDGILCKYCVKPLSYKEITIDHFFPSHMWELWQIEERECDKVTNLVIACQRCNFIKGNKSPLEWKIYPQNDLSRYMQLFIYIKRKRTHLKLLLNGTRTLSGKHKGWDNYKNG